MNIDIEKCSCATGCRRLGENGRGIQLLVYQDKYNKAGGKGVHKKITIETQGISTNVEYEIPKKSVIFRAGRINDDQSHDHTDIFLISMVSV